MIEIKMLVEGEPGWHGEAYGWWAKGHHDATAFCAAAATEPIDGHVPEPHEVAYRVWRAIPWGNGEPGGYYAEADLGKRGAFEVTIVDLQENAIREAMS